MVLVDAPRFIRIAFGGRVVRVSAPRFIRIAFGGRVVIVGSLLNYPYFSLKIQTPLLNFCIRRACRRAIRRIKHPSFFNQIYAQQKSGPVRASALLYAASLFTARHSAIASFFDCARTSEC
jgi:hypothetical protein